jgi:hypothetical protein
MRFGQLGLPVIPLKQEYTEMAYQNAAWIRERLDFRFDGPFFGLLPALIEVSFLWACSVCG